MGAVNPQVKLDHCSTRELRTKFREIQAEERAQYGSDPYSGSIGNVDGLIITKKVFEGLYDAEDWLWKHTSKWEEAKAVVFVDAKEKKYWLIGATCAN